MDQLVEGLVLVVKSLFFVLVAIVKCFVPNGILPRKQVNGEIVLITGSGSGLGRLMAYEFGKLGAQLILWDINEQGNEETRKTLAERGTKVTAYTVDLSNRHQINETAAKVKKEIGKVDILINNAGIVTGKKIFDCPDELMEKTMAVNTHALFYTAKNFLPAMLDSNHGHVVTIASMAGKSGVSGLVDYCASKHGAVGFNDSLTSEIKAQGKDVNTTVVCPYYINTGMFDGVETKSPILLPILDQEYVVECIMEAILTNRYFLAMPRFCYVVLACIGFLPTEVMLLFGDYMGVNATMDTFKGRHGKILKH